MVAEMWPIAPRALPAALCTPAIWPAILSVALLHGSVTAAATATRPIQAVRLRDGTTPEKAAAAADGGVFRDGPPCAPVPELLGSNGFGDDLRAINEGLRDWAQGPMLKPDDGNRSELNWQLYGQNFDGHCVWNVGELLGPQKWAFNGANERPPDLGVDGSADDSRGLPRHPGCACLEYRIGGDFA
jgi:hypothetical protein